MLFTFLLIICLCLLNLVLSGNLYNLKGVFSLKGVILVFVFLIINFSLLILSPKKARQKIAKFLMWPIYEIVKKNYRN